jgi:hypothetical protein
MVAPLAAGVARILMGAAEAGGVSLGPELTGLARAALIPLAESGIEIPEEAIAQTEVTIPVSSSAIRSISYHAAGIITVEFVRDGAKYDYPATEADFIAFLAAPSKGQWFNEHLR